jgi:hypothetical protein
VGFKEARSKSTDFDRPGGFRFITRICTLRHRPFVFYSLDLMYTVLVPGKRQVYEVESELKKPADAAPDVAWRSAPRIKKDKRLAQRGAGVGLMALSTNGTTPAFKDWRRDMRQLGRKGLEYEDILLVDGR